MTQESEQKIYNALMEFREDQATFNAVLNTEFIHLKTKVENNTKILSELEAIKDRDVVAMWLSGIVGGSGILAWLYSLVKQSS